MIEFRKYKDGEEESIFKLYLKVFNKKLSYDDWNWKYNGLYPNNKLIFLAFDDLLCVGHYALMPYRLNAFGKGIEAFISLDSMVHPNYQGKQVFSKLVEYAYNNINCLDRPYITFLNEKSSGGRTENTGTNLCQKLTFTDTKKNQGFTGIDSVSKII